MIQRPIVSLLLLNVILLAAGCSSDGAPTASTGTPGTQVMGALDDHCEGHPTGVSDPAACSTLMSSDQEAAGAGPGPGGADDDEGEGGASATADCNSVHDADYGATLYNAEGDDDDCKYHVSWKSTPIHLNQDVTFTVTTRSKADDTPLQGIEAGQKALSRIELYVPCSPTHFPPSIDSKPTITEVSPGVYTVGPVRFDTPGRWVVRFHFYESCLDQESSPHGHIAFFVDVP